MSVSTISTSMGSSSNKFDPMELLPREIGLEILSYLDKSSLANCCLVNKNWLIHSGDNSLWKEILQQVFPKKQSPPSIRLGKCKHSRISWSIYHKYHS